MGDSWSQITDDMCGQSFGVCGIDFAPFPGSSECKQIYWRKLKSMQDEVKSSDVPSIRV